MKNIRILISISLLLFIVMLFTSCDSASNSKAVSVAPPSLLAPSDMDTNVSVNPTFTWTGNANRFEISTNAAFNNIVHSANVTGNNYTVVDPPLQPGTYYYWHAGITGGTITYWSSDYYTFRTQ